ncbi:MAG TPA: ParB N-terminal domain-containing protein, partial [Fervidobacterium nodosum]|nr:ParB N-terminal domain-containing protein [Fervidobacterium nodosum]
MDKKGNNLQSIKGVREVAQLGNGISLCWCDVNILKEQDKNARIMKRDMFNQLVSNIKKRGSLESLPYCALVGDKIEIISGHHRVRASKQAGLKEIPVLVDVSGLTRSQIAAKQLAHNSINGFDDPDVLREISKMITDVDDMLESFVRIDNIPTPELPSVAHIGSDLEWKQVSFVFLRHQLDELQELIKNLEQKPDLLGIAHLQEFNQFVETLRNTQKFNDIKNMSSAIYEMIK